MQSKSEYINSGMVEEMAIIRLIVMDDVSGLATNLIIFRIFKLYQESMVFRAYMSFIQFIRTGKTGR